MSGQGLETRMSEPLKPLWALVEELREIPPEEEYDPLTCQGQIAAELAERLEGLLRAWDEQIEAARDLGDGKAIRMDFLDWMRERLLGVPPKEG